MQKAERCETVRAAVAVVERVMQLWVQVTSLSVTSYVALSKISELFQPHSSQP